MHLCHITIRFTINKVKKLHLPTMFGKHRLCTEFTLDVKRHKYEQGTLQIFVTQGKEKETVPIFIGNEIVVGNPIERQTVRTQDGPLHSSN